MSDSQSHPSADGSRNKAKDEEKERKKAEKLRKFEEKNAKRAASQATSKPEKTKSKTISDVPVYNDPTTPGEKKILLDLDHASLRAYNPAAVESSHYAWWEKMNFFAPSPEVTDKSSADITLRHHRAAAQRHWSSSHGSRLEWYTTGHHDPIVSLEHCICLFL